jgi:ribosome recycling factor
MINDVKQESQVRMEKSIDALKHEMSRIRTGRAHPGLLEQITVDYYGSATPLSQVANVSVADARMLTVTPWEKTMVPVVEKAIMNADLGLNPATAGTTIRVPMPPLTEERRKELIRLVRSTAENARIAIRNIRRDANGQLKDFLKEKEISEDDDRRGQEAIQKLTDKFVTEVDEILSKKESDLMEI